jgi:AT-rich interactive domain-containing protein 2
MNPNDMKEENEGPVTKSIRLTSALILRNLVNFSTKGRRFVTIFKKKQKYFVLYLYQQSIFFIFTLFRIVAAHESQLSTIAMSSAESSRTVSQLLFDMSEASD